MHQLNRKQYQSVIDALLRSAVLAAIVEEDDGNLDAAMLKKMATTVRQRVIECLALGQFDKECRRGNKWSGPQEHDVSQGLSRSIFQTA